MKFAHRLTLLCLLLSGCVKDVDGYCEADDECAAGEVCRLPAKVCTLYTDISDRCNSDKDCSPEKRCRVFAHQCEVGARDCQTNKDCQENQFCIAPSCVDATARGFFSGAQSIPPTPSLAEGTILFYLRPNNTDMVYSLKHAVTDATAVRIHAGKQGEEGGPVKDLRTDGEVTDVFPIAADQLTELVNGNYYVNITSPSFARSEVRAQIFSLLPGQVSGPTDFIALLTPQQAPRPNNSTASGRATVTLNDQSKMIGYTITTNLNGPLGSGIHIHRGAFNNEGPHIVDLPKELNPTLTGSVTCCQTFTDQDRIWNHLIRSGLAYFNLHTEAVSMGEIRGQLLPFQASPFAMAIPFNVKLEGAQVVPTTTTDAVGLGQFFLSRDQTKLTWRLSHTAVNPTSAQIRKGIRGDTNQATNSVVCDLGTGVTGSQGTCDVKTLGGATDLLVADLNQATGGLYLLIRTAAKPIGELRGQIIVPRLP